MGKHGNTLSELVHRYNTDAKRKTFKPENYLEIPRLFGPQAAIDMNRLVCQHQQHVASAYMRRIRKDKIQQRDVYFKTLQNIPMKIRRVAVGPNYVDPYMSLKHRLPKLGQDNKIRKTQTPPYPHMGNSSYVPHNSLTPNINVLFKMNPGGCTTDTKNNSNGNPGPNTTSTNQIKSNKKSADELPFPLSPRRTKLFKQKSEALPKIKKRLSIDTDNFNSSANQTQQDSSADSTPRCPTNSPRNTAFWNFNVPKELKNNAKKSHVSSIPRGREALAAINSVQRYNKPLPMIAIKV